MEPNDNLHSKWATYLLIVMPVIIVLSPSLTALVEVILYGLFLGSRELRQRFITTLYQPIAIGAFLLLAIILLSSFWSPASWDMKLDHIVNWRKVLLVPIALSLMQTPESKNRLLLFFIYSMAFLAACSWAIYLFDISASKPANALLRNHTSQAMAFFVAAFTAICLLLRRIKQSTTTKILLLGVLIIILANCFIISTSRSGYLIGIVFAMTIGLYMGGKRVVFLSSMLTIIVGVALYLSPTTNQQIQRIWHEANNVKSAQRLTSGGARVIFVQNSIPVILSSPIFGHGLKSFAGQYAEQVKNTGGWQGTVTGDPHNQYLLLLAEQGIVGLFLFFVFISSCFLQKTDRLYKFLGMAVLAGWMATSLFNGHFSSSVEGRFIFLWCAAMLAMPLPTTHYRRIS